MPFEPRIYRDTMNHERFRFFNVLKKETDLWIGVSPNHFNNEIKEFTELKLNYYRSIVENYIAAHPEFLTALKPLSMENQCQEIIRLMLSASTLASVGPMAAVAGAFCEMLGKEIMKEFLPDELVIENGGDIYLNVKNQILVQFFAGQNKNFSNLALCIPGKSGNLGICTSSGMFGHSFSYGKADSVTVVSESPAIADAYATSLCNKINVKTDVPHVLSLAKQIPGILSLTAIKDDEIGIIGKYPVKPVS